MRQEEAKKVLQLIIELQKIDKEALQNLERLVLMAKNNPAKYKLALKFL